jgi:hypothetical protein
MTLLYHTGVGYMKMFEGPLVVLKRGMGTPATLDSEDDVTQIVLANALRWLRGP